MLIKIPTLIVHGEKDTEFQSAVDTLKQIPSSKILTIKNTSHACYVQRPIEFLNGLRLFLYTIYRPIYVEQYKNGSTSLTNISSLVMSTNFTTKNSKNNQGSQ